MLDEEEFSIQTLISLLKATNLLSPFLACLGSNGSILTEEELETQYLLGRRRNCTSTGKLFGDHLFMRTGLKGDCFLKECIEWWKARAHTCDLDTLDTHPVPCQPILQQPIFTMNLGTWDPTVGGSSGCHLATLKSNASLGSALSLLLQDRQSELFHAHPYEPQNHIETTLVEAFSSLQPKLKPPFSPCLLSSTEYVQLNRALLYGILTQPPLARTHFTHLCAVVVDEYDFFVRLLLKMVNDSYLRLLQPVKAQLMWVCDRLMDAEAAGIDDLLVSLLRQIIGGDYSSENLWLSNELILVLRRNWDWVLGQKFLVGASLYTFLRLLADHYRLASQSVDALKRSEIEFCIMVLSKHFGLCLSIGRDLIRLLHDVTFIPEFRTLWNDLLTNPSSFGVLGFSDILHIYRIRTSTQYLSLRITPEVETNLRFLLTNVKWGNQKRYQFWFKSKFLGSLEKETLVPDLVRFICCAVHPSVETLKSDVISRWAVIGWLLKCCTHRHYYEANVKLAMFYDWLFFDERMDDFINLEPVILLIVNSIPQYVDITNTLLEFLFQVMDNYDVGRRDIIINGFTNSFGILVKNGLVDLMKLSSCSLLSPCLRDRLRFFSEGQSRYGGELLPRKKSRVLVLPDENYSTSFPSKPMDDAGKNKMPEIITLIDKLGEFFMQSRDRGLEILEKLVMWMTLNELPHHTRCEENIDLDPCTVAERITNALKVNGYEMFVPLNDDPNNSEDDEVKSATAIVMRAFLLLNSENLKKMMLFWSRISLPVGPRLLSYVSRLAYEAQMASETNDMLDNLSPIPGMTIDNEGNDSAEDTASGKRLTGRTTKNDLLEWHIDGHIALAGGIEKSSTTGISHQETGNKSISALVEVAFTAYTAFLGLFRMQMLNVTHSNRISKSNVASSNLSTGITELDECLTVILVSHLRSCCAWQPSRVSMLFCSVFDHLPGLSTCKSDAIHLLVGIIDHEHLVSMQFKVGLKRLTIFGNDAEAICSLVRISLAWNFLEQQRFWSLLTSELMVSKGEVPKILLKFCSQFFDPQTHSVALFGLFTLVRSQTPTLDLINTLLLCPPSFRDFSAVILASWTTSSSILFSILKKWLHEVLPVNRSMNLDVPGSKFSADKVNTNAILEFLHFLDMLPFKSDMWNSKSDCISEVRGELLKLAKKVDMISSSSKKWPP